MPIQRQLFAKDTHEELARAEGYPVSLCELNNQQVTFLGGTTEHIHSWFTLRPSFSPYLVRFLLKELGSQSHGKVLDPFSGAFTTSIECQRLGFDNVGVEINPLFAQVASYVLDWHYDLPKLNSSTRAFLDKVLARRKKLSSAKLEQLPALLNVGIPPIYNPFRWWRKDVLKELLIIKSVLNESKEDVCYKICWVALAVVCVDVANVKRMHPTIAFYDRSNEKIEPLKKFEEKVWSMLADVKSCLKLESLGKSTVVLGDSTELSKYEEVWNANVVITSPPYPNRYSYVWETRPQLYFMDIFSDRREATDLDLGAIGGTWGMATSVLMNGQIEPAHRELARILTEPLQELGAASMLMRNYAVKYFNMLYKHLRELRQVVRPGATCAYVVGNSRLKGVDIHTDVILGKLFEITGFEVSRILMLRSRLGKKKLYEAVVIAHA